MPAKVSRELIERYFRTCISYDPERIASWLDDNVEWSCAGPVDLIHFCGTRRGKDAVLDVMARIAPSVIRVKRMELEQVLIEDDKAATFMRLTATHVASNRIVSYRCAQFLRFRDGKLVEFRALIDSFDAAEQMLGHPIELPQAGNAPGDVLVI